MKLTVLHHRILAGLILMLLGVLIPLGRSAERLVNWMVISFPDGAAALGLMVVTGAVILSFRVVPGRRRIELITFFATLVTCASMVRTSAEWCHIVLYGLLGFTTVRAAFFSWGCLSTACSGVVVGWIDESIQGMVPGRVADPWDILLDLVGVLLGLWAARLLEPQLTTQLTTESVPQ